MAWDKGFNFRQTSGFVTDPADHTYVLYGDAYPVTRNGVTFGFTGAQAFGGDRDRNAGIDPRIAGLCLDIFEELVFRVDLPGPGNYQITFAGGDASNPGRFIGDFKDGATTLFSLNLNTEDNFIDANGTFLSTTDWPTLNTPRLISMEGSTLTVVLNTLDVVNEIAHLFISQVASGNPWYAHAQQ